MQLSNYFFPIEERSVSVHSGHDDDTQFDAPKFKAIVRSDNDDLISIVKDSYKVIENEDLIKKLMYELVNLDSPFKLDPSHSFCHSNRMRLQVTFPDITIKDNDSSIALSLFLSNSYDMSEGLRLYFGAIRAICSNGMVFGKVFSRFYGRHTKNLEISNIAETLKQSVDHLPVIQSRIHELEDRVMTPELAEKVEKEIGKKIAMESITPNIPQSQWTVYNNITNHISHSMDQHLRARYQMATAKVFDL